MCFNLVITSYCLIGQFRWVNCKQFLKFPFTIKSFERPPPPLSLSLSLSFSFFFYFFLSICIYLSLFPSQSLSQPCLRISLYLSILSLPPFSLALFIPPLSPWLSCHSSMQQPLRGSGETRSSLIIPAHQEDTGNDGAASRILLLRQFYLESSGCSNLWAMPSLNCFNRRNLMSCNREE